MFDFNKLIEITNNQAFSEIPVLFICEVLAVSLMFLILERLFIFIPVVVLGSSSSC